MFTIIRRYLIALLRVLCAIAFFVAILWAANFPYSTDIPLSESELAAARKYYTEIYLKPSDSPAPAETDYDRKYQEAAERAAKGSRIVERINEFVDRFDLNNKPVLEIGSGRGYLQDAAKNYVGLDISPSVKRFYHKKFVVGTATALPFADDSFDGIWSIWVFEHVPNPEQAFREMRRVIRNNGVIYLLPAWNADPWAAEGYAVRPYSDFGLPGKVIKASLVFRSSNEFRTPATLLVRGSRSVAALFGPTTLRYRKLQPNYEQYWVNDSDAVNSIDSYEGALWFLSRGDECLSCGSAPMLLSMFDTPLIIRVHKSPKNP